MGEKHKKTTYTHTHTSTAKKKRKKNQNERREMKTWKKTQFSTALGEWASGERGGGMWGKATGHGNASNGMLSGCTEAGRRKQNF